jgi:hypothetical protein
MWRSSHRQQPLTVRGVARFDRHIEDQAAAAGGQVELVAVRDLAALADDVDLGLEQADQLVAGPHRFAGQDPSLSLGDDPLDQGPILADLGLPELDRQTDCSSQLHRSVVQIGQGGWVILISSR